LFALAAGCGNNTPVNTTPDLAMAPGDLATTTVDLASPQPDMTLLFPVPAGCNTATVVNGTTAFTTLTGGANCAGGTCHNSGQNPTVASQAAFMTAVLNKPSSSAFSYVVPNNPDRSYLLYKLTATPNTAPNGNGSQMPQGKTPLTAVQMCVIYDWILHGAPAT
jgi:hypothetical protein